MKNTYPEYLAKLIDADSSRNLAEHFRFYVKDRLIKRKTNTNYDDDHYDYDDDDRAQSAQYLKEAISLWKKEKTIKKKKKFTGKREGVYIALSFKDGSLMIAYDDFCTPRTFPSTRLLARRFHDIDNSLGSSVAIALFKKKIITSGVADSIERIDYYLFNDFSLLYTDNRGSHFVSSDIIVSNITNVAAFNLYKNPPS